MNVLTSIHGRRLGLTAAGNLSGNGNQMTSPCVDAEITVGAEANDARAIAVQFKDANGNALAERVQCLAVVLADANGDAPVTTGGSTGIAAGADGWALALVAKKVFLVGSEADGTLDLTWTDTGTEVAYLGLLLPTGRLVVSDALTNA